MALETSAPGRELGNAAPRAGVAPRGAERQRKVLRGAVGLGSLSKTLISPWFPSARGHFQEKGKYSLGRGSGMLRNLSVPKMESQERGRKRQNTERGRKMPGG